MIKKTTKIIFENAETEQPDELMGGIPLSKGEVVHVRTPYSNQVTDYQVVEKTIDYLAGTPDQEVNITYILRKV